MEPLATVEEVAARADEPMPLSPSDEALANSVIAEASALVRHYGTDWATRAEAPAVAATITVAAAARGFVNPVGLNMERGDAVTFNRSDMAAEGLVLTTQERAILRTYKPITAGVVSIGLVNPDAIVPRSHTRGIDARGYAPLHDGTKPFPLGVRY